MLKIYSTDAMCSLNISTHISSLKDDEIVEYTIEYKMTNLYLYLIKFNIKLDNILKLNNYNKNILNNIILENLTTKLLFNFNFNYDYNVNDIIIISKDILDDISHSINIDAENIMPIYNILNEMVTIIYEIEIDKSRGILKKLIFNFNLDIKKCMISYLINFIINYKQNVILFNTKIIYLE